MELKLSRPQEKWFYLAALPIAIAIEWAFAATQDWSAYPRSEWVALIDLCLFMPLVYLGLFSSTLPRKARLIRALGIAGLGLFAASFIVPADNQFIIGKLSEIRYAFLAIILLFEGWLFWKILGAVFQRNADAQTLEREFAIPQWIAKLMVLEAKFWKAVWSFLRGK
ncbi:MAG: hypothetical protein WBA68_02905 [Alteraurantiacibacter sp.]